MQIALILLCGMLFSNVFGQKTESDKNLFDILSNAEKSTYKLYTVYDLNIFDYYDLKKRYDTELKRELYKKTTDYAEKLAKLKNLKARMLMTTYFTEGIGELSDYDVKRKGFRVQVWSIIWSIASECPPKGVLTSEVKTGLKRMGYSTRIRFGGHFDTIYLKALPTHSQIDVPDDYLPFIPTTETDGLEIEENCEDIVLYYLFTPVRKESVAWKYCVNIFEPLKEKRRELLVSDRVRVILANGKTGKIYFDKTYTYQPTTQKGQK